MKKKTYKILSKIPIINALTDIIVKPVLFCSPGIADGIYDDLFEYMKKHPDILMTDKLAKTIRRNNTYNKA